MKKPSERINEIIEQETKKGTKIDDKIDVVSASIWAIIQYLDSEYDKNYEDECDHRWNPVYEPEKLNYCSKCKKVEF